MRARSALSFALPLVFALSAALTAPAFAEETAQPAKAEQPANAAGAEMRVYKRGDKFVVAIFRADGSAALALVEPPKAPAQTLLLASTKTERTSTPGLYSSRWLFFRAIKWPPEANQSPPP